MHALPSTFLAVVLSCATALPALADEPAVDLEEGVSDEHLERTLLLLQRRRIALQVHQVLATTAFVAVLAGAGLTTAGLVMRAANVPASDLQVVDVAEVVASITSLGSYSPAGIIAWAAPSPTGYITGKGIKPPGSGRDRHIVLSILHGLLYGAYYTTGIVLWAGVPDDAREGIGVAHAAVGFGAAIVIGIASDVVDRY